MAAPPALLRGKLAQMLAHRGYEAYCFGAGGAGDAVGDDGGALAARMGENTSFCFLARHQGGTLTAGFLLDATAKDVSKGTILACVEACVSVGSAHAIIVHRKDINAPAKVEIARRNLVASHLVASLREKTVLHHTWPHEEMVAAHFAATLEDPERASSIVRVETFLAATVARPVVEHMLYCPHRALCAPERDALLARLRCRPDQLPRLLSSDPVARYFGFAPGTIVEIRRLPACAPPAFALPVEDSEEVLYYRQVVEEF